jgi:hypothetical protein
MTTVVDLFNHPSFPGFVATVQQVPAAQTLNGLLAKLAAARAEYHEATAQAQAHRSEFEKRRSALAAVAAANAALTPEEVQAITSQLARYVDLLASLYR